MIIDVADFISTLETVGKGAVAVVIILAFLWLVGWAQQEEEVRKEMRKQDIRAEARRRRSRRR